METNELLADPVPPSTADVNMQDSETGAPAADNGIPDSGDNPVQMETDVEVICMLISKYYNCLNNL